MNKSQMAHGKNYFPLPARELVGAIAQHIRTASGCTQGAELALSCPQHAQLAGFDFAVVAESIRRATILADPRFCERTFLSLPVMEDQRNTPGALLQQLVAIEQKARSWAREYGISVDHTLSFSIKAGPEHVFGTYFHELLFGFMLERPCIAEVEALCGVALDPSRTLVIEQADRGRPRNVSSAQRERAVSMPLPRVVLLKYTPMRPGQYEEDVRGPGALHQLARMYKAMRRLLPIASPYAAVQGSARVVNVAVHLRAGSGTKTAPELAFIPILDSIADILEQVRTTNDTLRCTPHVHVFHEYEDGKCCATIELWGKQRLPQGVRVIANIDPHRAAMWHALWSADVLIAGESKLSHTIGGVSPELGVFIDGSPGRVAAHALRFTWEPCGPHHQRSYAAACQANGSKPTAGLARGEMANLRSALARACANR